MKPVLTICGILFAFLIFLSIEIKGEPIFAHIYDVISPATRYAQNATERLFSKSYDSTEAYGKKLFNNSVPKVRDSVDSKLSSTKKKLGEPAEKILEEEKEELDDLIKKHK